MVKIIIRRGVHVFDLPQDIRETIARNLTFDNPVYKQAKIYGRFIGMNVPEKLEFYAEQDNVMFLPKGYTHFLLGILKNRGIEFKIEDMSTKFKKIDFTFKGEARPYQDESLEKVLKYPNGVLESGTGSGKTVMGINMIARRKQPTIILVHTKELVHQWQKSIRTFLGVEAGVVGDGKFDVRPITIGLVKSVQNRIEELKDRFGFVIVDECHRTPASTWIDILSQFTAKYCLGLSATGYRNDGLGGAIYYFIGPKMHEVDKDELIHEGAVLKPKIIRIRTDFFYFYKGDYASMMSSLARDRKRNELIIDAIKKDMRLHKTTILVVSDRVEHCYTLQDMLDIESVVLTSKTNAAERTEAVERVRSGDVKVLFSTIQLIGEGFDAPNIHALFLTTPIKYRGRLMQVVGRVLRPEEGKTARVYDFIDHRVKPLLASSSKREQSYRVQWGKEI